MRKTLTLGAVAASEAEGADLVWRQGYYEALGGTHACFAAAPLCVDALCVDALSQALAHSKHAR